MLMLTGLVALQIATFSTGSTRGQYLVIAPPGASQGEAIGIIGQARGGLQDITRFPNVVIASSSAPDFPEKLHEAGAWIVLPAPVKSGCYPPASGETIQ
ncbi:hypothetical protein [Hyphomonas neptunium]|nr:hypothetical protein [Hyphomonas neptunium]